MSRINPTISCRLVAAALLAGLAGGCERQNQAKTTAALPEVAIVAATAVEAQPPTAAAAPAEGAERAKELAERLDRVGEAVNRICGSDVTVMLSETGRGGMATGLGIVRIDMTVATKVSEDALAGLMAHEFAHEVLGHATELAFLGPQNRKLPSRMQQMRELERRADEFAGWVLAQTSYDPNAFEELLKLGPDTAWVDPLMRSYYPTQDRMRVLLESYESTKSGKRVDGRSSIETVEQEATP